MNTGHFTQVVWKSSTQLGIGVAPCEMQGWKVIFAVLNHFKLRKNILFLKGWLVVGRYKKHGNMRGDFEENVMPKL